MNSTSYGTNVSIEAKHHANMLASLDHRLQAARAANNTQLVALLERERQQLTNNGMDFLKAPMSWMKRLQQGVARFFSNELDVQEILDENGRRWWRAYDPQTGKTVYTDSQSEVMLWIEQNYRGR
jgi:hypothetical protein